MYIGPACFEDINAACLSSSPYSAIGVVTLPELLIHPIMTRIYPPYACGNRLLVETALDLADSSPDRIYAAIPQTNNLSADGFRDVTFRDWKCMTTWLAGWIEEAWGKSSDHGTIAYLGVSDLRPTLIFFAAAMSGYKASSCRARP